MVTKWNSQWRKIWWRYRMPTLDDGIRKTEYEDKLKQKQEECWITCWRPQSINDLDASINVNRKVTLVCSQQGLVFCCMFAPQQIQGNNLLGTIRRDNNKCMLGAKTPFRLGHLWSTWQSSCTGPSHSAGVLLTRENELSSPEERRQGKIGLSV